MLHVVLKGESCDSVLLVVSVLNSASLDSLF